MATTLSKNLNKVMVMVFIILLHLHLFTLVSSTKIPYSTHCNSFVAESAPTSSPGVPIAQLRFSAVYFTGGDRILGPDPNSTFLIPKSLSFRPRSVLQTLNPETLKIAGTLVLRGGGIRVSNHQRRLKFRISPRNPRSFVQRGRVSFDLEGFWSKSSGKLCMVGDGSGRSKEGISLELSAVFKLNYPNSSNISNSVVSGVVESVDDETSLNYFDPIRILAYTVTDYEFTKVSEAVNSCSVLRVEEELLDFGYNRTCVYINTLSTQKFRLEYGRSCLGHFCGPFDRGLGYKPIFLGLNDVQCLKNGMVRMYIWFSDRETSGSSRLLDPHKSLIGEGVWDHEKKRLCLVACRILNVSNSLSRETVNDCTVRLSFWFSAVLSIENMGMISGRIWSARDKNDAKYFNMVSIGNFENGMVHPTGVEYRYTQMGRVRKYCARDDERKIGESMYPDTKYIGDMRFDIRLTNAEGKSAWGYANPLFIGENSYSRYPALLQRGFPDPFVWTDHNQSLWNVSYKIGYTFRNASVYSYQATEISAEGTYDAQTGVLCMVGCRREVSSLDCELLINIQLAPMNPKQGEHLKGTIKSLRKKSDPLFFKPLDLSSYGIYRTQAAETIKWMDAEIVMVLTSLTFSCVFIVLQLLHVKKNPGVLPSISITMLAIFTLGYMIPLVLNFEALFLKNHNKQDVLLRSGGWLPVNEVLVRVITLIAFLLQFWLLQLAWYSRSADVDKKGLWIAERKSLLCCLPVYLVGGLIALLVHLRSLRTQWADMMSYAGFMLDNFLLPQFLLNVFWKSNKKSLAASFYFGMTFVRALPHVYDAYRARHYVPHLSSSYIYASLNEDFYSSAWDIIIPCEVLVMAVLICAQQQFGGAFILPRRIKEPGVYEMVPVEAQ